MANNKNLRKLTTEEAREIGKLGGIASGKVRKEKKMLKDLLEDALSKGTETDNEYINITLALIKEAKKGNTKAYEVIRDTLGQKIPDKVEVNGTINKKFNDICTQLGNKGLEE